MGQKHSGWAPTHGGTRVSSAEAARHRPKPAPQPHGFTFDELKGFTAASDSGPAAFEEQLERYPLREDDH